MQDKYKEHMNSQFGNMKVTPPDNVWQRLENSLDRKKKRRILLFRIIGGVAAMVVLFIGVSSFWSLKHQSNRGVDSIVQNEGNTNTSDSLLCSNDSPIYSKVQTTDNIGETENANKAEKWVEDTNLNSTANNIVDVGKIIEDKAVITLAINNMDVKLASYSNPTSVQDTQLVQLSMKQADMKSFMSVPYLDINSYRDVKSLDEQIMAYNIAQKNQNEALKFRPEIGTQYAMYKVINSSSSSVSASSDNNSSADISGGVSFTLNSNKRIGFQTGVYYSQMSNSTILAMNATLAYADVFSAESEEAISSATVPTNWGGVSINEADSKSNMPDYVSNDIESYRSSSADVTQKVGYIEVPFIVRYTIIDRKLGFDVLGGINSAFLVNNSATLEQGDSKSRGKTDDLKTFTGNSVAGVAIKYSLTPQLNIGLEPKVKYYYNSLSNNNNFELKPVVFGVYAGISYAF